MDKEKILRLCHQIEMIIVTVCNTGYTLQPGDEEAIFNRTKAIMDEVSEPPKTNADHIRHMTDEQLAEWFAPHIRCSICDKKDKPHGCNLNECKKYALAYMKKKVDEDVGTDC